MAAMTPMAPDGAAPLKLARQGVEKLNGDIHPRLSCAADLCGSPSLEVWLAVPAGMTCEETVAWTALI